MRRGRRSKVIGLITGAVMLAGLFGAGSAFAATGTAPGFAPQNHDKGKWEHPHPKFLLLGKIVKTDGDTFVLATRMGKYKVHWDHDTKFKNGDSKDLDEGKIVAVVGKKTKHGDIHAEAIAFIKHKDRGRH
jgi:uncharacterized Zn-binding protein involved in type VI secretion